MSDWKKELQASWQTNTTRREPAITECELDLIDRLKKISANKGYIWHESYAECLSENIAADNLSPSLSIIVSLRSIFDEIEEGNYDECPQLHPSKQKREIEQIAVTAKTLLHKINDDRIYNAISSYYHCFDSFHEVIWFLEILKELSDAKPITHEQRHSIECQWHNERQKRYLGDKFDLSIHGRDPEAIDESWVPPEIQKLSNKTCEVAHLLVDVMAATRTFPDQFEKKHIPRTFYNDIAFELFAYINSKYPKIKLFQQTDFKHQIGQLVEINMRFFSARIWEQI